MLVVGVWLGVRANLGHNRRKRLLKLALAPDFSGLWRPVMTLVGLRIPIQDRSKEELIIQARGLHEGQSGAMRTASVSLINSSFASIV